MKTRIKFVTTVWMIALLSSFGGWNIAAAQDTATPTPEPTAEVTSVVVVPPEATVEPAPTDVSPVPVEPEPKSLFSVATLGELLFMLGLSALAGGGIVAIALSFLGKKEVRDRVEDARNSWSPEQQAMLSNFTALFERVSGGFIDFLKAVQDGKPNEDVVAQVLRSPELKAGVTNQVNKVLDESVGIRS